jgi:hypothetical protein
LGTSDNGAYTAKVQHVYGDFWQCAPFPFDKGHVLTRWQGIEGHLVSLSLEQLLRKSNGNPDHTLLEYRLNGSRIPIFSESDFYYFDVMADPAQPGYAKLRRFDKPNVTGYISERIAVELTRHWLKNIMGAEIEEREYKPQHIFENTTDYILKVLNPPRMTILRKRAKMPNEKMLDSYQEVKELDGLLLCRLNGQDYVLAFETKSSRLDMDVPQRSRIERDLVEPLKALYPDAKLLYVITAPMEELYVGGRDLEARRANNNMIRPKPVKLASALLDAGIGTLYFGFRSEQEELKHAADNIMKQRILVQNKGIGKKGRKRVPSTLRLMGKRSGYIWAINRSFISSTEEKDYGMSCR